MTNKLFVWTILFSSLALFSCEDENTPEGEVSSDEAKLEINMLAEQASADITRLTESEGINGAMDLLSLLEEFDFNARNDNKETVRERLHLIAQYFVYGPTSRVATDDESFSFDDIKGLYVWNPSTESFDKSSSEFLIIQFPTEGSATNNAELKIANLELVTITEDYGDFIDEYQVPSVIDAYLKIDGEEVISLDFLVNWTEDGFPEKADVRLFLSPFTFNLGFDDSFPNTSSLVTSVALDGEVIVGVDVDVEFETADKEDPSFIEGFVQYYNLKVAGTIDVPTELEEETGDINDFINLELLLDDEKIGDIVFEEDIAYVLYADGSKELLEDILEPIIEDIEAFFEDFEEA